jgi:hypothetical protein
LIGNALGDSNRYLIGRWSDAIILTVAGCTAWIGTIAITKRLGRRRYLPRMLEMQQEVFQIASSVIEHDGLYKEEVGQSSVVIEDATRQRRRADATRQLDQIGRLIDLPRQPMETDNNYLKRIQPFFLFGELPFRIARGRLENIPLWIQAVATLVLVFITAYYAYLTHNLLKIQVESELSLEIETTPSGAAFFIRNDGTYPVVRISIDPEIMVYLGPPRNQKIFQLKGGHGSQWRIPLLKPGEIQSWPINELGEVSLKHTKMLETSKASGKLGSISPKEQIQFWPVIIFRMTAHREVDLKPYRKVKIAVVFSDSNTGKPIVQSTDYVASVSYLQEFLKQLSKQAQP